MNDSIASNKKKDKNDYEEKIPFGLNENNEVIYKDDSYMENVIDDNDIQLNDYHMAGNTKKLKEIKCNK